MNQPRKPPDEWAASTAIPKIMLTDDGYGNIKLEIWCGRGQAPVHVSRHEAYREGLYRALEYTTENAIERAKVLMKFLNDSQIPWVTRFERLIALNHDEAMQHAMNQLPRQQYWKWHEKHLLDIRRYWRARRKERAEQVNQLPE